MKNKQYPVRLLIRTQIATRKLFKVWFWSIFIYNPIFTQIDSICGYIDMSHNIETHFLYNIPKALNHSCSFYCFTQLRTTVEIIFQILW